MEIFKYVKTVDFTNSTAGTFNSNCDHPITKYTFRIHQDDSMIVSDIPKFTKSFKKRGFYDVTCISKKDCNHQQNLISTHKFEVELKDMPFIRYFTILIYILLIIIVFRIL